MGVLGAAGAGAAGTEAETESAEVAVETLEEDWGDAEPSEVEDPSLAAARGGAFSVGGVLLPGAPPGALLGVCKPARIRICCSWIRWCSAWALAITDITSLGMPRRKVLASDSACAR